MLYYQYKNQRHNIVIQKIILYVISVHCIIMFIFFFVKNTKHQPLLFEVNRFYQQNFDVVLMSQPTDTVKKHNNIHVTQNNSSQKTGNKSAQKHTTRTEIKVVKKNIISTEKKLNIKKHNKKNIHSAPQKPNNPQNNHAKKDQQKKDVKQLTNNNLKNNTYKKTENVGIQKSNHQTDQAPVNTIDSTELQEYAARNEYIAQEVKRVWKAPAAVTSDTSCILDIELNAQGTINKIYLQKSSGITLYDITAQQAVKRIVFPVWAWSKKITITLKA